METLFYYKLYNKNDLLQEVYDSLDEYCGSELHEQLKQWGSYQSEMYTEGYTREFLRDSFLDAEIVEIVSEDGIYAGSLIKAYGTKAAKQGE